MSDVLADAKRAIAEVFGDTSVSRATTVERLEELAGDIETNLDALRADAAREEREALAAGDDE